MGLRELGEKMTFTNFEDLSPDMQEKVNNLKWKCSECGEALTDILFFKWLKSCDQYTCKLHGSVINVSHTKLTKAQIKHVMARKDGDE